MYSPDGTKACGSRGGEFEGIGSMWGLNVQNRVPGEHFLFSC